ncbi:hypothetical protein [Dyadobacter sediminis]|uniref:Uncharacterized protein n=1 Tax=Dyadobacter sediminis TaxID=1493691 RepID=A0A5R9KC06_9BACT|nr:hypothetical protein [Dyadobacter sediminis]TLU92298.1 hypothetical protein FEM55_16340 [Dyadobacter sediminis]GGB95655.1 hypothetical protein GCM10011325_23770 [Dyadobacter sediminis]
MKLEKVYSLAAGREAKVIVSEEDKPDFTKSGIRIEVLIKDPRENEFHLPITETHPQFWKLKRLDADQCSILQYQYSGITEKQVRKAIKEYKQLCGLALVS